MSQFRGKVALVTGGASGIGAATATLLASLGARVSLSYHANRRGAEEVQRHITERGGRAAAFCADLRLERGVGWLVESTMSKFGPVDVLVNCAASLTRTPPTERTQARCDQLWTLNVESAMSCAQRVVPKMQSSGGVIINVCSIAGLTGGTLDAAAQSAAKARLQEFTRAMADDLKKRRACIFAITPRILDTPPHEAFCAPWALQVLEKAIPLGRTGFPIECAMLIAELARRDRDQLTGMNFEVSGRR